MMGWIVLLIIVVVIALIPYWQEQARAPSEAFRKKAPGRFAKLSQGVTHYQWVGAARGPVIVCIHGLTTPSPVWYAIAGGLERIGYRILIYDLYGRGFSDAVSGPQDGDFFVRQLSDLLEHQQIEDDVTLIGYSMGGAIATAFTAAYPHRVRRMVLLASAGMWLREDGLTEKCREWPLIGDWLHAVIATRRDKRALRKKLGKSFEISGIVELQLAEYRSRGFVPAVLSSRRHMLAADLEPTHREIAKVGVPVLGIWAEKDDVIPLKSLGTLSQWNRDVAQEVIQGAGHDVAYTHSQEVVAMLAQVLREDAS
ncbi:MAG: alpha/beta hydrolase [Pseudomonadota bacterium]